MLVKCFWRKTFMGLKGHWSSSILRSATSAFTGKTRLFQPGVCFSLPVTILVHCLYLMNGYQFDKTGSQMVIVAPDSDGEPAENVERNVESNAREYIFGAALWPLHICVLGSESKLVCISKRLNRHLPRCFTRSAVDTERL